MAIEARPNAPTDSIVGSGRSVASLRRTTLPPLPRRSSDRAADLGARGVWERDARDRSRSTQRWATEFQRTDPLQQRRRHRRANRVYEDRPDRAREDAAGHSSGRRPGRVVSGSASPRRRRRSRRSSAPTARSSASLKAMLGDVDVNGKSAAEVLDILFKKFGGVRGAPTWRRPPGRWSGSTINSTISRARSAACSPRRSRRSSDVFDPSRPMLQTTSSAARHSGGARARRDRLRRVLSGVTALVTSIGGWGGMLPRLGPGLGATRGSPVRYCGHRRGWNL